MMRSVRSESSVVALVALLALAALLSLAGCATTAPQAAAPATTATATAGSPSPANPATPAPPAEVLARIGGETITVDDFRREMERRGGRLPGQFATPEQRRALLSEMIDDKAVLASARAAGLDRDPEIQATLERLIVGAYLRQALEPALAGVKVAEEEVAAYYAAHRDEYRTPERRRVAWLFLAVSPKADAAQVEMVRQRAEAARAEAASLPATTMNLGEVAKKYSEDGATRYTGGELGWLVAEQAERYRWGPDVVAATYALAAPGDLSPVLRHEKGFYFLKLVAREAAAPTPLEKLDAGIRARLLKERRQAARDAFFATLLEKLAVSIDEARLAALAPPSPPAAPEASAPPSLPQR